MARTSLLHQQQPELLSRAEVAQILNLGLRTVDRYVQQGELPRPCRIGNVVRFHRKDIEGLIASRFPMADKQKNQPSVAQASQS